MLNYDHTMAAARILLHPQALGMSKRRITLSTVGIAKGITRLAAEDDLGLKLAISLHATNDALRDVLVPLNKKYNLEALIAGIRAYPGLSNARRVTFEYVMLKDVNDSPDEARALVKLIEGIPAKVNLIPFNPWPGTDYQCSDWGTIERFALGPFEAGGGALVGPGAVVVEGALEQAVLVPERAVQAALAQTGRPRELPDGGAVEPGLVELPPCGRDDLVFVERPRARHVPILGDDRT